MSALIIEPYSCFIGINKFKQEKLYMVIDVPGEYFNEFVMLEVGKPRKEVKRIQPSEFHSWLDNGILKPYSV